MPGLHSPEALMCLIRGMAWPLRVLQSPQVTQCAAGVCERKSDAVINLTKSKSDHKFLTGQVMVGDHSSGLSCLSLNVYLPFKQALFIVFVHLC